MVNKGCWSGDTEGPRHLCNTYDVCVCSYSRRCRQTAVKKPKTASAGVSVDNACSTRVKYSSVDCRLWGGPGQNILCLPLCSRRLCISSRALVFCCWCCCCCCLCIYQRERKNVQTSVYTLVPGRRRVGLLRARLKGSFAAAETVIISSFLPRLISEPSWRTREPVTLWLSIFRIRSAF